MQRVYIGTRTLQGAFERYAKKFNLLEIRSDPEVPLSSKTLRRWRKSVPPTFAFSVVLPPVVTELRPSADADRALDHCIETATLLESPVMLIANPISVTPTAANRKRLEELVRRIPHDVVRLAWEPPGLWEEEETRVVASRLGLVLVGDAARDPLAPGSVAYTRLRGLGDSRRLSLARLDKVVERLQAYREVFVIIETDSPMAVAKAIRTSAMDGGEARVSRARHVEYPLRAEDEEQE
jgi:uncharacterized protein YecE (DUF72 family)